MLIQFNTLERHKEIHQESEYFFTGLSWIVSAESGELQSW